MADTPRFEPVAQLLLTDAEMMSASGGQAMQIISSQLFGLSAERHFTAGREVNEMLDMQRGGQRLQLSRHERSEVSSSSRAEVQLAEARPAISRRQLDRLSDGLPQAASATGGDGSQTFDFTPDEESLHKLRMLLVVLGRSVEEIDTTLGKLADGLSMPVASAPAAADAGIGSDDFLNYRYSVQEWRGESLSVNASGTVNTADGRAIQYGLSLEMLNMQYSSASVSVRAGAALKDPLVLNLDGGPVRLDASKRVDFDLDADGRRDSMASLASGSAFLALDRNSNGRIDDGRELFGALSGDGFADLSAYDEDGNGFIDEGDSIFEQLRLWRPDAQGKGDLVDLLTAGVGAIGLARAYGDFDLVAQQQLEGRVRSTGFFLFESGQAGSVQQIDLAI